MTDNDFIVVGKVIKPHGIKGGILVKSLTDFADFRFQTGESLFFQNTAKNFASFEILSAKSVKDNNYIIYFKNMHDRDSAESLAKSLAYAPYSVAEKNSIDENTFHARSLYKLAVVDLTGKKLGTISKVISAPAHDILVVSSSEGNDFQIPFVKEIVIEVAIPEKKIIVDLPEGLLDI